MANTAVTYQGNGITTDFAITFDYLARKFVRVDIDGTLKTFGVEYNFIDARTISFVTAPAAGTLVTIRRNTSATERIVEFRDASVLKASDLDLSSLQTFHIAEEAKDLVLDTIGTNEDGGLDARFRKIVNLKDGVNPNDAINYGQYTEDREGTYQAALAAKASAVAAEQLFVSSGASLVGYSPSGAGAIATSVQTKLRESISVKDFGAVGDGVTDDTTAFTRAAATGKVILIPESDNQYQVTGDFSSYTFVSLGRVDPTNNATIEPSLLGFAYNTKCNDTNISFIPVGTTKSFAFKGHNEGAMNYWGGDSSGADNPGVGGTGTGITFYGRLHDTYAEEIKLRALNKHPLWFKAQTDFSSEYADFGTPSQIKGFWYAEDFSLMGLDRLQTTGLDVKASGKRVRIDDADMTVGDSTASTFYEINHRNSSGYLQFDGGQNQAEGFCVRLYGNATGTESTSDGMIWYANNIQQFRYRYDIKQFDFKANTTKYTPALVSALPSASTQGAGARAFVSDATATTFASIVSGGGSNKVPVYSDGTNWRIG